MRRISIILLLACGIGITVLQAKPKSVKADTLSAERQQQFLYYYYAAEHALLTAHYTGKYDEALVMLELCDAINPHDGKTKELLGILYNALEQDALSMSYYRQAYELEPQELWERYALALIKTHDKKNIKTSIRIIEQAVKEQPKEEERLTLLRDLYAEQKQYAKAIRIQDRIAERHQGDERFETEDAVWRRTAYWFKKDYKRSLRVTEDYLTTHPTDASFHLWRTMILTATKGSDKQMTSAYEDWVNQAPSPEAWNSYAYYLAEKKKDLDKAESLSLKAIMAVPDNPAYLDTFGWIQYQKGNYTMAEMYLRRALRNCEDGKVDQEIQQHIDLTLKKLKK